MLEVKSRPKRRLDARRDLAAARRRPRIDRRELWSSLLLRVVELNRHLSLVLHLLLLDPALFFHDLVQERVWVCSDDVLVLRARVTDLSVEVAATRLVSHVASLLALPVTLALYQSQQPVLLRVDLLLVKFEIQISLWARFLNVALKSIRADPGWALL